MNYIEEYNILIQTDKIITSKRVKKAYANLFLDIRNPKGNWIFNEKLGSKPIEFIERFCKHSKGEWAGQPVKLELFQKAFIQALFGFVDKNTGLRKYKEAFFLVARKNGKSTLISGIMLYMLIADNEAGSQIVSAATKREQACITFNECLNMVNQSPELSKHCKKRKSDLLFIPSNSTMQPLASQSNSLDGLNLHLAIIDELHAIKSRDLYEVLKQSMSARQQPLLIMITTAGSVRENIFDDMYNYSCQVVDGIKQDERFLPIIYELDKREEWTDRECWLKANPSLGTIKKLEDIVEKVERCKQNPKDLNGVLCKDFNIRVTSSGSWLSFDDLNNEEPFDLADFKGSYAVGGVDLSTTTDLSCATLILMKPNSDKRYVLQQYFLPANLIQQRSIEDKIPYDIWQQQGLLTASGENKIDYTDITAWFLSMVNKYEIRPLWIGYDPWNANYWVNEMKDTGFNMEEVRQGCKTLSNPMKELESDLKEKMVNYNNNPILKWCLSNLAVKEDLNGNIQPIKQNSRQRIDGAVSLIIAYTVLSKHLQDYKNMI